MTSLVHTERISSLQMHNLCLSQMHTTATKTLARGYALFGRASAGHDITAGHAITEY